MNYGLNGSLNYGFNCGLNGLNYGLQRNGPMCGESMVQQATSAPSWTMEDFHHFRVYQDARSLTRDVWRATRALPWCVQRTLVPQLDNACESIGANIAEGCGRKNRFHGNAELIRYLHFSYGSSNEADHRLGGLFDRELLTAAIYEDLNPRLQEIKRKLRLWNTQLYKRDRGRMEP